MKELICKTVDLPKVADFLAYLSTDLSVADFTGQFSQTVPVPRKLACPSLISISLSLIDSNF